METNKEGMVRSLSVLTVGLALWAGGGCANVKVHKVPIEARTANADSGINGFRYYLPRPYIVVKDRIFICEEVEFTRLVMAGPPGDKTGGYALEALVPRPSETKPRLYDLRGNPLPSEWTITRTLTPAEKPDAVKFTDPPSELPSGKITPEDEVKDPTKLATQIQVVMLPDFEEQYAISNINKCAYSKYEYEFQDGWGLSMAKGTYDATELPIRFLQSVTNTINAAAELRKEQMKLAEKLSQDRADVVAFKDRAKDNLVIKLRRRNYIEPGIYKLLKSWEREKSPDGENGLGLLADLGLPVVQDVLLTLGLREGAAKVDVGGKMP